MIGERITSTIYILVLLTVVWLVVDSQLGWRPRFGLAAYMQEIIRDADVAEVFQGSAGHNVDDATAKICDRVDAGVLNGLGIPVDDRTSWPEEIGGAAKPMDIWTVSQDKGWLVACRDGLRHLKIEIDRTTLVCTAEVRLWHTGCAI